MHKEWQLKIGPFCGPNGYEFRNFLRSYDVCEGLKKLNPSLTSLAFSACMHLRSLTHLSKWLKSKRRPYYWLRMIGNSSNWKYSGNRKDLWQVRPRARGSFGRVSGRLGRIMGGLVLLSYCPRLYCPSGGGQLFGQLWTEIGQNRDRFCCLV